MVAEYERRLGSHDVIEKHYDGEASDRNLGLSIWVAHTIADKFWHDCHWMLVGAVGFEQTGVVCGHLTDFAGVGRDNRTSIGVGMHGRWLSLTMIRLQILWSNGISAWSCGSLQRTSHRFHPVPRKFDAGFRDRVSSPPAKHPP